MNSISTVTHVGGSALEKMEGYFLNEKIEAADVLRFFFVEKVKSLKALVDFIEGLIPGPIWNYKRIVSEYENANVAFVFRASDINGGESRIFVNTRGFYGGVTVSGIYGRVSEDRFNHEREAVQKFLRENKQPFVSFQEEKSFIHILVQTSTGLEADRLGADYSPLVRENYSPDVLAAFDKTALEFSRVEDGDGFISVFSGPPGTGKSFLLRALIGTIKDSLFLYVPANLISSFAGPSFIGVLRDLSDSINDDRLVAMSNDDFYDSNEPPADLKSFRTLEDFDEISAKGRTTISKKKNKIVLILEDADDVLAPRAQTDMGGINSILNLTDGILGKILNIRIIATTNSLAKSLDYAIVRPGRLCVHSEVGTLSQAQAQQIFEREGGKIKLAEDKWSLAEVYKAARDEEFAKKPQARRVGF